MNLLFTMWTNKEWGDVVGNNPVVPSPHTPIRGSTLNPTYIRKMTTFLRYDLNLSHMTTRYYQSTTTNLIVKVLPLGSPPRARQTYLFVECDCRYRRISLYLKARGINVPSWLVFAKISEKRKPMKKLTSTVTSMQFHILALPFVTLFLQTGKDRVP